LTALGASFCRKRYSSACTWRQEASFEAIVDGGRLVATPVVPEVKLIEENGRLVATTSQPVPRMTHEELLRLIDEDRDTRR